MILAELQQKARTELGTVLCNPDSIITDFSDLEEYLHDATDDRGMPSMLIMAECENDVLATVNFCRKHKIPIVPRGAGTGLSGGCVPVDGSVLLSTERIINLTVDSERRLAVCGPGVITKTLMDAAIDHGLAYPPDPASYDESTIGGNVAEGAGGLRCKRFGVTKDYIIGLRAVTISGNLLVSGPYYNSIPCSIADLLIASEGTLAIITEIAVRLIEKPKIGTTIFVAFNNPRSAAQTVSDITSAGIVPTVMEFIDGDAAACSNEYEKTEGFDSSVEAILLLETSGEEAQAQTAQIEQFCRSNDCSYLKIEPDAALADNLWKVRRNLSKAVKAIAPVRISEDIAVPNSKFPDLVQFVAEMNRNSAIRMNSFGHAGDGNLHVNFLSMTGSDEDLAEIGTGIEKLMRKALALGGTLSGEHGIGLAKKKYLPLEFDNPTLDFMKAVKSVFDPDSLLNPGKIFP